MTGDTSCILSFDVGTTSTKACLYRIGQDIELLGSAMSEYPIMIRPGGWAEQNPQDWLDAVVFDTKRLLKTTGITPSLVSGISFSSQMQGLVLVGEDGFPLRPAVSYMDQRAVEQKENFAKGLQIEDIPVGLLLSSIKKTGIAPTSVKDPLWKYLWVKENEPEIFEKVRYWFDVKDYLIFRLTGKAVCTRDSACATALFDNRPRKNSWSISLCKAYGVDPHHLPRIIQSHEPAGLLSSDFANLTGLSSKTPVFGGGGDASTIGIGSGAVEDSTAHVYMGTSGWVSVVTPYRELDLEHKIASITCAIPDRYHYFCEQETSGKCLEWVRDHLALDEIDIYLEKTSVADDPESIYKNLFEYLGEVIDQTEPGCGGLLFAPWLHGSRSPFEDPNARGMFFNISLHNGKRDMIRSVVEGLAYSTRWMLESIEKKIPSKGPLRFVGGGALSKVTAQIMADITGREMVVPENPHNAGALGAAFIAAVGLKLIPSLDRVPEMVPVESHYIPRQEYMALYDRNYQVFKKLHRKNKSFFKKLNSINE